MNIKKLLHYTKKYKVVILVLLLLFFAGLYLRNLYLPNHLFFGFEQGRDALVIMDILSGEDFTLLGPKTDIDGIFHGVGYYYVLAAIYAIAAGDPGRVIMIFTAINALTIFIVYFLAKELIGKTTYALLAAALACVSFDIIIYGRWLSNVSFSIPLVALFFYFFTLLVKTKNPKYWIFVGLSAGVLSHFELLHILYAFIVIVVATLFFRLPIKNKQFFIGIGLFILTNISFILFEMRHNFLMTNTILNFLSADSTGGNPLLRLPGYIEGLLKNLNSTLSPFNTVFMLVTLLGLCIAYLVKKPKKDYTLYLILMMVFFSFPFIFLFKGNPLDQFYAGTSIGWILLFTYLLSKTEKTITKYTVFVLAGVVILGNIIYTHTNLLTKTDVFYQSVQPQYIYQDQLATLDLIFARPSNGFTIDAFTVPYFNNQAWLYLYDWYGSTAYVNKYERNQNIEKKEKVFVVVEPGSEGVFLDNWLLDFEKSSTLLNKETRGSLTIYEREYTR